MERITAKHIRAKVEGLQQLGIDIAIEYVAGKPRCTNKQQSRDISPRLSTSEISLWLSGFAAGLEASKERSKR